MFIASDAEVAKMTEVGSRSKAAMAALAMETSAAIAATTAVLVGAPDDAPIVEDGNSVVVAAGCGDVVGLEKGSSGNFAFVRL